MANVTVAVDEDLKEAMDEHPEINWSEVARQAFSTKLEDLELLERIAGRSELTEDDVAELGDRIDAAMAERLLEG